MSKDELHAFRRQQIEDYRNSSQSAETWCEANAMKVSTLRYLWTQGDGSVVHFTEHKGTVLLCTLLAGKPGGIWMEKFSLVALDSSFCLFPMSCASFCSAKLTEEFEFSNQSSDPQIFCPQNAVRLMSNRLHIFHPKDSCDNTFIRLINGGIF